MFITSAFSLNMLKELNNDIAIRPISAQDVRDFNAQDPLESAVGHDDTATIFSNILGFDMLANRITLELKAGDRLIVGQYRGPRLKAGATKLPEGATIEWALVVIRKGR